MVQKPFRVRGVSQFILFIVSAFALALHAPDRNYYRLATEPGREEFEMIEMPGLLAIGRRLYPFGAQLTL